MMRLVLRLGRLQKVADPLVIPWRKHILLAEEAWNRVEFSYTQLAI